MLNAACSLKKNKAMKRIVTALLVLVLASCGKDEPTIPIPVPTDTLSDARTVLLKQVVVQNLPSPFFKFVYDEDHFVTEASFASSLDVYKMEYEDKRVKKVSNTKNGRYMLYNYSNGNVASINEFGLNNQKLVSYEFLYNSTGKLIQVNWKLFAENAGGEIYKQHKLSYHADGNLAKLELWVKEPGPLHLASTETFDEYDNSTNVDDFYLLKEFFDSFLFLPQVKLQVNNPHKHNISNGDNEFEITYTYDFNTNNLPVKKSGIMKQTKGPEEGKIINLLSTFSYY